MNIRMINTTYGKDASGEWGQVPCEPTYHPDFDILFARGVGHHVFKEDTPLRPYLPFEIPWTESEVDAIWLTNTLTADACFDFCQARRSNRIV